MFERKFIHNCATRGLIEDVVITEKYQNKGLGKFMIQTKIELAKSLVKYGADHCLTNRDGFSTLQIAVFSGHPEMMMYILSLSSHRHS